MALNSDFDVESEPPETGKFVGFGGRAGCGRPLYGGFTLPEEVAGQTRRLTIVLPHELEAYGRLPPFVDVCRGGPGLKSGSEARNLTMEGGAG